MIVLIEKQPQDFEWWRPAVQNVQLISSHHMLSELDELIEELYPSGIEEVALNDLLAYYPEQIFEILGIPKMS